MSPIIAIQDRGNAEMNPTFSVSAVPSDATPGHSTTLPKTCDLAAGYAAN